MLTEALNEPVGEPRSRTYRDAIGSGRVWILTWALVGCPQLLGDEFRSSVAAASSGGAGANDGGHSGSGNAAGAAGTSRAGAGGDTGSRVGASAGTGAGAGADRGAADAGEGRCLELGDFTSPAEVSGLGVSAQLWAPSLSSDGQLLAFSYEQPSEDIYLARRGSGAAFSLATDADTRLVNTAENEGTSFLSFDGLSLYFYSIRGDVGDRDLYVAKRLDATLPFESTELVAAVNGTERDHQPWVSSDELTLYFTSARSGGSHIWRAARATRSAPFGTPALVSELSSNANDERAALSRDELQVVFMSERAGGLGEGDLWMSSRASVDDAFEPPTWLPNVNSPQEDAEPALSADGRELFFSSNRDGPGLHRLYRATRQCL